MRFAIMLRSMHTSKTSRMHSPPSGRRSFARLYSIFDPDPTHLSHAQVDEEIALTQTALASQLTEAGVLVQLGRIDPGFTPAPTKDELNSLMRITETERDRNLAEAIAITNGRVPPDLPPTPPGWAGRT